MIEINNLTNSLVNEKQFKKVGLKIFKAEGVKEKVDLSVVIVNRTKIKELNRIYRGKNKPTDVLSFNYSDKLKGLPKNLGEIVLCPLEINIDIDKEIGLTHIFIHGLLHLLGYDHENQKEAKIMQLKEQKYLTFIKK
ncbi:MAG: rRNA maturation RNase YbeY [Candidatus Parcubacteria bacterium]|nr:rRNA maturation RNase YbeY [Candidatus Parcubacteria bacterium]